MNFFTLIRGPPNPVGHIFFPQELHWVPVVAGGSRAPVDRQGVCMSKGLAAREGRRWSADQANWEISCQMA